MRLVLTWSRDKKPLLLEGERRCAVIRDHQIPDGLYTFNVSCQFTSARAYRATGWHTEVKLNFARSDYQQACQLPSEAHGYREVCQGTVWKKKMCSHFFFFPISSASTQTKFCLRWTWRQYVTPKRQNKGSTPYFCIPFDRVFKFS
jgi:hypothetical protein